MRRTAESQVWWEGDTGKLNDYYLGHNTQATHVGGTIAERAREAINVFWGRPTTASTTPMKRLHVPLGGVIPKLSATELFGEPLRVLSPDLVSTGKRPTPKAVKEDPLQVRSDLIFNTPRFHAELFTAGESASALGGNFQRVVWDVSTGIENAWIDFVDEDRAIPEYKWGRLVAVTFWSELEGSDGRVVWRWLQRYEPGRIVHGLYCGTGNDLGRAMPLTEHPATASLATQVRADTDGYSYVETGIKELAAEYVPNVLPNPEWRHDPKLKYRGRADISTDGYPLLHELDRVYSSLMKDFRVGSARGIASSDLLQSKGAGQGLQLAEDQEFFTSLNPGVGADGSMESMLQFYQPAIRVLEHDQGGDMLLRALLQKTGYSPSSIGLSDEVAQTATEVRGKKARTIGTTSGKSRYWGAALGHITTACLRIDAIKFPGKGVAPSEEMVIEWPNFARESDLTKSQTLMNLRTAQAVSTRTAVAYWHEDWDDDQIQEEVDEIDKANVMEPAFPTGPDQAPTSGDGAVPFAKKPETNPIDAPTEE
jgi:hypothetical protein